jgi:hypothetical protein
VAVAEIVTEVKDEEMVAVVEIATEVVVAAMEIETGMVETEEEEVNLS